VFSTASTWGPVMTDAAIPVTQTAVERFTDQYLRSVNCTVEKHGNTWDITVPESTDSDVLTDSLTLICGDDVDDEEDVELLHPESTFFQQLLAEASERNPTGKISIETRNSNILLPGWLRQSNVEVSQADFTPYYDRTAIVVLFQVGIETVSEYQTQLLRAVAMDTRTEKQLPALEQAFLDIVSVENESATSEPCELDAADVQSLLDTAGDQLVDRVEPEIDEIHQEASRAADAEVEEYRQLQQQRLQELEEQHANLTSKIDELSEKIGSSDESERVEALKRRKELKAEYEELDAELTDLRQRRDQGFPDRQREIRDRHSLEIQVKPLTVTEVEYERGEIEFELTAGDNTRAVTIGYGSGVGVTDSLHCDNCDEQLNSDNPIDNLRTGTHCSNCSQHD